MKNLYIVLLVLLSASFLHTQAQGSIGIGTSSPDNSAILDITSTTKGALLPRMTTAQRDNISSKATGLIIYNTSVNCYEFYHGTAWQFFSCKCSAAPFVSSMSGPVSVGANQSNIVYSVYLDPQSTYTWSIVGTNVSITTTVSGLGVNSISVTTSGPPGVPNKFLIKLSVTNACGTTVGQPLLVSITG